MKSVEGFLGILLDLHADVTPDQLELPAEVNFSIRQAVRQEIPLYCVMRAVWIAQESIVDNSPAALRSDRPIRQLPTRVPLLTATISNCAGRLSDDIARLYLAEVAMTKGEQSVARTRIVTDLLADVPVDHRDVERVLGFDVSHHHLAIVLWAASGSNVTTRELNRFAGEMARVLGGRWPLILPATSTTAWIWTGWPMVPEPGLVRTARETLSPPEGVRAAVGPLCPGPSGFRRSHFGARAAERMAAGWTGSWLFEYEEIAVVSLLMNDPQQAAWFVEETLGELGRPGRWVAELRETLRIYLAFGRSRARAAERLHIARNTVAYRVEKATRMLDRPITEDPLKVRLALEISRVLPRLAGEAEPDSVPERPD
jgi:hypothetical protein